MICPYCNNEAPWVSNDAKYGRRYGRSYMCYYCKSCDAYVGCHNNTRKPLGTMANKELREWRMKAHAYIDPFWKELTWQRNDIYKYLQIIFEREIHIGASDIKLCKQILKIRFPMYSEYLKIKDYSELMGIA